MSPATAPLVGEPLALDLLNTRVGPPDAEEVDLLRTPETSRAWFNEQQHRLAQPPDDIDLAQVRELRDRIEQAVHAARHGTPPSDTALQALTEAQRGAPAYREVSWDGQSVAASQRRTDDATKNLLAELAEATTDLLTDPAIRKVRQCEGPGCRLLFLPAHPRRRWCSPALCGNRVRVARYYQRHKQGGPQAGASPPRSG